MEGMIFRIMMQFKQLQCGPGKEWGVPIEYLEKRNNRRRFARIVRGDEKDKQQSKALLINISGVL